MNMKKMKRVSLTLLIVLAGAVSLSAALTYSPPAPKTGETVTFTVSPTSGNPVGAISWNFGDGTPVQSGASLTVTHVYTATGSYTVSAAYPTMTHAQVDRVTVTVNDPRQINFSPSQPKAGQTVIFNALDFYSNCIRWDFGDGAVKNGASSESHAYAAAGSYTVRAYEECGGTYGASVSVTVAPAGVEPPAAPSFAVTYINLYFSGGKTDVSVAKDSVSLQAFADIRVEGTGILQWQWLVDGMAVRTDTLAVSFSGKYTLDSGRVPGLPTSVPGRHQVMLRFQNPKTDLAIPAITYFAALKGPAPVVNWVTPSTLAPGSEYDLELEGGGFTPGTEISFPAPLALVRKAVIISPTRAQATVFVPPTAGSGEKTVGAWNEYGKSNGPGRLTVAPPKPATVPGQANPSPAYGSENPGQSQFRTVTFICPAGGESWLPGKPVTISYRFWMDTGYHSLWLCRNNVPVGLISSISIPVSSGQIHTLPWRVGWVCIGNPGPDCLSYAPPGEYTIGVATVPGAEPKYFSNPFKILDLSPLFTRYKKIYYAPLPKSGDGPESFLLDLPGLHDEMVNSENELTAGLYFKGKLIASMGTFGKGRAFAAKLPITPGLEALAVIQRGEELELRLFDSDGKRLHSQQTQLVPGTGPAAAPPPQPGTAPSPASMASLEGFKDLLKKTPVISGGIDFYHHKYGAAASYGQVGINVKKGGTPVSGAIVKVDGNVIPESANTPGLYFGEPQLSLQPGHVFKVTVQIGSATYAGSGGMIDTIVRLTQPTHGSTIFYKQSPQFNCTWTFSNGPAQVHLYVLYIGQPGNKGIFEQDLSTDHAAVPTATIPGAQGQLYFFLGRKHADIKFDGLLAFTSSLQVYQNYGQPQSVAGLSDIAIGKASLNKTAGAIPDQAAAAQAAEPAVVAELKNAPQLNGSIIYRLNSDPDSPVTAYATYNFSRQGSPIADAVIQVDGVLVPPNPNSGSPDYGCSGCYKYEGPWPAAVAAGHMTAISLVTSDNTLYSGSGGVIDAIPQLAKPAPGASISLAQTPYANFQWTGAGGGVPVHLRVVFQSGGVYKELFNSAVSTDHAQVQLNILPPGSQGVLSVTLIKRYENIVMEGALRFTSAPAVFVENRFDLQLIP
jgi:PKD repeat protein